MTREKALRAAALDHRQNLLFRRRSALADPALAADERAFGLADIGFVDFDRLAFAAQGLGITIRHRFADTMRHGPSRAVGAKTKVAHKLMGGNALLARRHEMKAKRPFVQRDVAGFHDRPDRDRIMLTAGPAGVKPRTVRLALDERRAFQRAAMRADRVAVRPTDALEMGAGNFGIGEQRVGQVRHV